MSRPDAAASEPATDMPAPAFDAAFAPVLTRRHVGPPLILSVVVSAAAVTSFLALVVPIEGAAGESLNPVFDRFLGNWFSRAILGVFVAAAIYAALHLCGVAVDRGRLRLLDAPVRAASASWVALLSGRTFRPDAQAEGWKTIGTDAAQSAAERFGAQRYHAVKQGLAPLRFVVWVLPLLGFIGTVWGISGSITGLESVIGADGGGQPTTGLLTVLDGLRFAFDTTLLGLATVIPVMAVLMMIEGREDALTEQGRERVLALAAPSRMAHAEGEGRASAPVPNRAGGVADGPED